MNVSVGWISRVSWFLENCLDERMRSVKVNWSVSALEPITSEVPQGSIVGPLLFLILFNNLSKSIFRSICFPIQMTWKFSTRIPSIKCCSVHRNATQGFQKFWRRNISRTLSKAQQTGSLQFNNPPYCSLCWIRMLETIKICFEIVRELQ